MSARPRLTARDIDALGVAVRTDRVNLAAEGGTSVQAVVEKILAEHIDPLEEELAESQVKVRRLRRKLRDCRDGA